MAITKRGSSGCLVLAASGTLYGVASHDFAGGEFFQVVANNGGWTATCLDIDGPNATRLGAPEVGRTARFGAYDVVFGLNGNLFGPAGQAFEPPPAIVALHYRGGSQAAKP